MVVDPSCLDKGRGHRSTGPTVDHGEGELDRMAKTDEFERLLAPLLDVVAERLGQQCHHSQIIMEVKMLLGKDPKDPLPGGFVHELYVRGKERLLEKLSKSKAEAKCEALEVYDSIIRDPDSKACEIISAQVRKDRLLGLESVKQVRDPQEFKSYIDKMVDVETTVS